MVVRRGASFKVINGTWLCDLDRSASLLAMGFETSVLHNEDPECDISVRDSSNQ